MMVCCPQRFVKFFRYADVNRGRSPMRRRFKCLQYRLAGDREGPQGEPAGAGADEIARQPLLIGPAEVFRDDAV